MLKGILTFLVILMLLAIAFVVGSQNETQISVNYLIAQAELRISTLIAITLSLGVLVGVLIMMGSWLHLRVQLMATKSKLQRLEQQQ